MPIKIKLPRATSSGPHHFKLDGSQSTKLAECEPCQTARAQELAAAETAVDISPVGKVTWSGPIIFESQMTGDGRYIEPNALTWENLPIPLRFAREDTGEHNGAVVVGRILSITRKPGGVIWATGDFDTVHPDSIEAARQVREQLSNGVSADLDNVSFEVRVARELIENDGIPGEPVDGDGDPVKVDENGRVTVLDIDADAEVMDIDDARIRAATLVAVPAFEGARIQLDENDDSSDSSDDAETGTDPGRGTTPDGKDCSCDEADDDYDPECDCITIDDSDSDDENDDADDAGGAPGRPFDLIAAAAPARPPADWFTDPGLDGPTPLTITDDGHVFGHLAVFDSCHTAFAGECVAPPRSPSGYGYFRTGTVITDNGQEIPVGHITLDTFHAGKKLGAADTIAHYEHTGATVADIAAGEDQHGIWVAGATRPNLSDDQLRTLRSSPLSGDWRRIGGNLELVAALAVNVPGFPIPRPQGMVASSGAVQSLVASGMVKQTGPHTPFTVRSPYLTRDDISEEALDYLRRLTANDHNRLRAAKLRRRVRTVQLARRVQSIR